MARKAVLTSVDTDITLLEDGLSADGAAHPFRDDFRSAAMKSPVNCSITNQAGSDMTLVSGCRRTVVKTGSAKPM
ncbi:MAG: hypothetical protein MSB10_05780 [Clostridiales bacterium]|uniref:hypothetical protein n=1 Tax=Flavonifractor porci TaxID=3133422 RepID=UPI0030A6208D|nr:hypothetical protein [Clostridiales bacterium]